MFLFLISLFAMLFYELSLSYCPDIMRFQTGLFWPETESVAVLHIECFFPGSKKQNLPTYMTNSIHSLIYFSIHVPIGSDHSLNNAKAKAKQYHIWFLGLFKDVTVVAVELQICRTGHHQSRSPQGKST